MRAPNLPSPASAVALTLRADWVPIVQWFDELVHLADSPVARLNGAVAVGQAPGLRAGLTALAQIGTSLPRYAAAVSFLHERDG